MADTLSQPLAEALVKVKLVYDKSEIKSGVGKVANQIEKETNKTINTFNKLARQFEKVSALIFKTLVAPLAALATAGIYKYLRTSEIGAGKLRLAIGGLKYAFDQFLARIGRVIYNSGILTNIIEKLKGFLNSLDDKKIKELFDRAKWGIAIWGVTTLTSKFIRLGTAILEAGAAWATINIAAATRAGGMGAMGALIGYISRIQKVSKAKEAVAGSWSAYQATKFSQAQGAMKGVTAAGRIGSYAKMSEVKEAKNALSKHMKNLGTLNAEQEAAKTTLSKFGAAIKGFIGKLLKFLLVFDALAALFRGFGFKFENGLDMIWSGIKGIAKVVGVLINTIDYVVSIFASGFEQLGNIIRFLNPWSEWTLDQASKRSQEINEEVKAKRPWGYKKPGEEKEEKKLGDMRFLGESISNSSFEGLNAMAQQMITLENEMKSRRENTDAIKANTEELKKQNVPLGIGAETGIKGGTRAGVGNFMIFAYQ